MITVIYFWRIKRVNIPVALIRMAIDRTLLRRTKGVTFAKMLGCGKGETFTPSDADPTRWGCLVVIPESQLAALDGSMTIRAWRNKSESEFRVVLDPIAATGMWSKRKPFEPSAPANFDGQVVAITRARIKASQTLRFFKSVPPVTASLHSSPGLISTIGIGEAPIGLQGTFSIWESMQAIKDFAYKGAAHQKAIAQTAEFDWYAEELFARFAVREIRGTI
ncbi:MAG: spheroidene monooxygenase [Actinobacteria bacterium]|nr:spheroidene monooxygenase [Actinomycetota bacterium]